MGILRELARPHHSLLPRAPRRRNSNTQARARTEAVSRIGPTGGAAPCPDAAHAAPSTGTSSAMAEAMPTHHGAAPSITSSACTRTSSAIWGKAARLRGPGLRSRIAAGPNGPSSASAGSTACPARRDPPGYGVPRPPAAPRYGSRANSQPLPHCCAGGPCSQPTPLPNHHQHAILELLLAHVPAVTLLTLAVLYVRHRTLSLPHQHPGKRPANSGPG